MGVVGVHGALQHVPLYRCLKWERQTRWPEDGLMMEHEGLARRGPARIENERVSGYV